MWAGSSGAVPSSRYVFYGLMNNWLIGFVEPQHLHWLFQIQCRFSSSLCQMAILYHTFGKVESWCDTLDSLYGLAVVGVVPSSRYVFYDLMNNWLIGFVKPQHFTWLFQLQCRFNKLGHFISPSHFNLPCPFDMVHRFNELITLFYPAMPF